ncbi:MAG: PilZ domain-containing protein [Cyanothece sp. SIO1E1]|nr:PilZ domain-containing protein [Cyanothece sp. SIO1E1]
MFGFGKKKDGDNKREHDRIATKGEEVRIYGETYPLGDLSEGGMRVTEYNDMLQANQYFEFHLVLKPNGKDMELRGHAKVVRQWDDQLAVQFTKPQPDLVFEVRDYLEKQL